MNEGICKGCQRYVSASERPGRWWCAQIVSLVPSTVVPGHSTYERDRLYPMRVEREIPPEWCEYAAEQTVSDAEDEVNRGDRMRTVRDGNRYAEIVQRNVMERGW